MVTHLYFVSRYIAFAISNVRSFNFSQFSSDVSVTLQLLHIKRSFISFKRTSSNFFNNQRISRKYTGCWSSGCRLRPNFVWCEYTTRASALCKSSLFGLIGSIYVCTLLYTLFQYRQLKSLKLKNYIMKKYFLRAVRNQLIINQTKVLQNLKLVVLLITANQPPRIQS